jgi:DNA-binding XRE family transcriptional regulator
MKLSELKSHQVIVAESLKDPAYRAEWERTRFAHEVAIRVIQYRVEHHLTQTELARRLGMRQPHVARLEAGDHEPSLATLRRLAQVLGLEFHIDITPDTISLTA